MVQRDKALLAFLEDNLEERMAAAFDAAANPEAALTKDVAQMQSVLEDFFASFGRIGEADQFKLLAA